MTLATLFLAQAMNVPLSLGQQLTILGIAMLTSKGTSGVIGGEVITLAATVPVVADLPIAGLALLVGVDSFMSECMALTNLVGNGMATVVIARWEGNLDCARVRKELARGPAPPAAVSTATGSPD